MFGRRFYTMIPVWENRTRHRALTRFRSLVVEYFESLGRTSWNEPFETDRSRELRELINRDLHTAEAYTRWSGVDDRMTYREAPMSGGRVYRNLPLISNLFNLNDFEIPAQNVLDMLDRAIGNLENDRRASARRTANPLFWLGLAIEGVGRIPFALLGRAGFDRAKIEDSTAGKLLRLLVWFAAGLAGIISGVWAGVSLLDRFNLWDRLSQP